VTRRIGSVDLWDISGIANPGSGGLNARTVHTPPLVESADRGPFFHTNAVETKEAVALYKRASLSTPPSSRRDPLTIDLSRS
jgi:hypothetical protein